jgi:hypothetical protein
MANSPAPSFKMERACNCSAIYWFNFVLIILFFLILSVSFGTL